MRRMHYLRLEIARCHNIRALLQDYYCTFKFKVAMAMDQFIERFKTLRVHCSVTFQRHVKQSLVLNLPGATKSDFFVCDKQHQQK